MAQDKDYNILYYIYPTDNIYLDEEYDKQGNLVKHGAIQFVADFAYPVFDNGTDKDNVPLVTVRDESELNNFDGLDDKDQQPLSHTVFYREEFENYVNASNDIIVIPYEEMQQLAFNNRNVLAGDE